MLVSLLLRLRANMLAHRAAEYATLQGRPPCRTRSLVPRIPKTPVFKEEARDEAPESPTKEEKDGELLPQITLINMTQRNE